jgi:hypothetical protein
MTLEIQILAWNRHRNAAEVNQLMVSQLSKSFHSKRSYSITCDVGNPGAGLGQPQKKWRG